MFRKVTVGLFTLLFLVSFLFHGEIIVAQGIDYEANIQEFVEKKDKPFKISELIKSENFQEDVRHFLSKESVDDEITWNELNQAIDENNGEFVDELFFQNDATGIEIFANTNIKSFGTLILTENDTLEFLDPKKYPKLEDLTIMGHNLKEADLSGFTQLKTIFLNGQDLKTINLSNLTNLKALYLNLNNKVDSLDLSDLTQLEEFYLSGVNLTTLDLSNLQQLKELQLDFSSFSSVELKGLQQLEEFAFLFNDVPSLVLEDLPKLKGMMLVDNTLQTLKMTNLPSLKEIEIFGSELEAIDVSQFKQLEALYITDSKLQSIHLKGLDKLTRLGLENNQLKTIDVSDQKQLLDLNLSGNQLKSIDLTGLTKLERLYLANNQLTTIDLSSQKALEILQLENNQLTSLKPFEHLLNNNKLRFFNISENKINFESAENKSIHAQYKKKFSNIYHEEYGPGYQYDGQKVQASYYTITIGGEKVKVKNGAKSKIPGTKSFIKFPHDLPEGTDLEIKPLTKQEKQKLEKSLAGTSLEIAGDIFKFTFDNSIPFTGKFTLTLSYDNEKYAPHQVAIYYFNEATGTWEKIGGAVDEKTGTITVEVDHFSIYGVLADKSANASNQVQGGDVTVIGSSNQDKTKDGKQSVLPNTATNVYNFIAVGILLVIVSVFVFARRKRQA